MTAASTRLTLCQLQGTTITALLYVTFKARAAPLLMVDGSVGFGIARPSSLALDSSMQTVRATGSNPLAGFQLRVTAAVVKSNRSAPQAPAARTWRRSIWTWPIQVLAAGWI